MIYPDIPVFDGCEALFQAFIVIVLQVAARACSLGMPHVLYDFASDEQRQTMLDEETVVDPHTDGRPTLAGNNPTAAAIELFKARNADFRIFQTECNQFYNWFLSKLSDAVIAHVSNTRNVPDLMSLRAREIKEHLIAVYGTPSQATMRAQLNILLQSPFSQGDNLTAHIKLFDTTLDFFERINEPFSDLLKYEFLVRSMATHLSYSSFISQYEISGTKTYGALARALLAHQSGLDSANAVQQMNQVTTAPATTTTDITGSAAAASAIPAGYKLVEPSDYCWTHGKCFHSSKDCSKAKTGHKRDAKDKRRMGGSDAKANPKLVPIN